MLKGQKLGAVFLRAARNQAGPSYVVKPGNTITIDGKTFNFVKWDGKSTLGANDIGIDSKPALSQGDHQLCN